MVGQHGLFILGSYGALLLAVVLEIWALTRRRRAAWVSARQRQDAARKLGRTSRFEEHA